MNKRFTFLYHRIDEDNNLKSISGNFKKGFYDFYGDKAEDGLTYRPTEEIQVCIAINACLDLTGDRSSLSKWL